MEFNEIIKQKIRHKIRVVTIEELKEITEINSTEELIEKLNESWNVDIDIFDYVYFKNWNIKKGV